MTVLRIRLASLMIRAAMRLWPAGIGQDLLRVYIVAWGYHAMLELEARDG